MGNLHGELLSSHKISQAWPGAPDERGYFDALTERVLGAVFEVSDTLGAGFLEEVYQRAPLHELRVEEALVRTDR